MGLNHSPKIVTDGLVFYYDMGNTQKSWKGKPTTNLLSDTVNYTAAANEWNAQENVTITRNQITPDGQTRSDCIKITCNSAVDSYFGVRNSSFIDGNAAHTISFWMKANKNFTMPLKFGANQYTATVDLTQQWKYYTVTTPTGLGLSGYFIHFGGWNSITDNTLEFYLYQPMYEQSAFATSYIPGGTSRSNTQSLIDLTGQNTITANSLTYASDGTFSFTKANGDYLTLPLLSNSNSNVTFSCWAYVTLGTNGAFFESGRGSGFAIGIGNNYLTEAGNNIVGLFPAIRWISTGVSYGTTGWKNVVVTMDASSVPSIYVNGNLIGTYSGTAPLTPNTNSYVGRVVGDESSPSERAFNGRIDIINFYNRALSAAEVKQNFNALRGRFGI